MTVLNQIYKNVQEVYCLSAANLCPLRGTERQ